jgi:hypothetical protein
VLGEPVGVVVDCELVDGLLKNRFLVGVGGTYSPSVIPCRSSPSRLKRLERRLRPLRGLLKKSPPGFSELPNELGKIGALDGKLKGDAAAPENDGLDARRPLSEDCGGNVLEG